MPLPKFKYLFPLLLFAAVSLHAQTIHVLNNDASFTIDTYALLPDNNYNLGQVINDPPPHFTTDSVLQIGSKSAYWVRFIISNPYPNKENYRLSLSLPLNYTLYTFDVTSKQWSTHKAGVSVPALQRERGMSPFVLQGNTRNTLYLKIDLRDIQTRGNYIIHPVIILEKSIVYDMRENILQISWLICIIVLLSFSGYNLYLYLHLEDPIYGCYLGMQIGAIIFITAFKHFFNLLLPFSVHNVLVNADGSMYYYGLNALFLHIGLLVIVASLIQLTRSYLRTRELMQPYDKVLRFLLYVYAAYELLPALITVTGLYYVDSYTLFYDNILILGIIATVFLTSAIAYKRRIRAAKHFLVANALPFIFGAATAVYFLIHSTPSYIDTSSLLPEIAILSQLLTFAVALVARIKVINEELKEKIREVVKLEDDITQTSAKRKLLENENSLIVSAMQQTKDKNEFLLQQLEANQRELVGNSLYIHQKNKLLADLKNQIQDIDHLYPHVKHPGLKNIKSSLNDSQYLDAEWDKFKLHFEQVHPGFFENLRAKHPSLTNNELRLYAYFHIHLSTKEIAALLNIEPASVRQAKMRLNKKMGNVAG